MQLRKLMYAYSDRYTNLLNEQTESEKHGDEEAIILIKALQSQCRVMTAELWHVMVEVGALDDDEIEFGSIKIKPEPMAYKEVAFSPGDTIEEAVNHLLRFKEEGVLVCGHFNGVTLYSDTVTMDGAYRAITGMKKAELGSTLK